MLPIPPNRFPQIVYFTRTGKRDKYVETRSTPAEIAETVAKPDHVGLDTDRNSAIQARDQHSCSLDSPSAYSAWQQR